MGDIPNHLAAYLRHFTHIQSLSPEDCRDHIHPMIRFVDPFSDVIGAGKLVAILQKTLDDVTDPQFTVQEIWMVEPDRKGMVKWRFQGQVSLIGNLDVTGISEIDLDDDGLVISHRDYWDAGLEVYGKMPLLGRLIRRLRQKLAVS